MCPVKLFMKRLLLLAEYFNSWLFLNSASDCFVFVTPGFVSLMWNLAYFGVIQNIIRIKHLCCHLGNLCAKLISFKNNIKVYFVTRTEVCGGVIYH